MQGRALAGVVALLLAACSGGGQNNASGSENASANAASEDKGSSNAQVEVKGMTDASRHDLLLRAISEAGQECSRIERSDLRQTVNNLPVYEVRCDSGAEYAVAIRDDGSRQVVPTMPAENK